MELVAVPAEVYQVTVTGRVLACAIVTVTAAGVVPQLPSVTEASPTDRADRSSSITVATAWPSAMVALVAPERLTRNVSSGSMTASPVTATVNVLLVAPDGIV